MAIRSDDLSTYMLAPISSNTGSVGIVWDGLTSLSTMSPPTAVQAAIIVEAKILSGITVKAVDFSLSTPLISITAVEAPLISAPAELRKSAKSAISGSLAALITVVVPFASTEARIIFSVAPTLGNGKTIFAPTAFSAVQQILLSSQEIL